MSTSHILGNLKNLLSYFTDKGNKAVNRKNVAQIIRAALKFIKLVNSSYLC